MRVRNQQFAKHSNLDLLTDVTQRSLVVRRRGGSVASGWRTRPTWTFAQKFRALRNISY